MPVPAQTLKSLMFNRLTAPAEPVPAVRLGRVHFTGIGGAGMSGIARIMLARGIPVSGSDARGSALLDELQALGASVYIGHDSGNLGSLGPGDTLVVSSAIRADNPELTEATRRGMRVLHRAAALASVMAGRRVIAVAGTHGKTTTTSMLTTVLRECGADPGYVIGGILTETGLGAEDGAGLDFVAEADESDGSFLLLSPDVAIITNVEADHLDNYKQPGGHPGGVHHVRPAGLRDGADLRGRPGRGGRRGAPGSRARPPVRRVNPRRLPARRRRVPGHGDQLHGGG